MRDLIRKTSECVLGYMCTALEKLFLFQQFLTEGYSAVAVAVVLSIQELTNQLGDIPAIRGSLTVLMLTRWPVLTLLCELGQIGQARIAWREDDTHGADWDYLNYQHKPFQLDFFAGEILRQPSENAALEATSALSFGDHLALLRSYRLGRPSIAFRALLWALEIVLANTRSASLEATHGRKVVLTTIIWGARIAAYLPGLLQRAEAFHHEHRFVIFCLDKSALIACKSSHKHPGLCVHGELKTIYNKFTLVAAILQIGFDVILLDTDVVFLKDPLPPILKAAQEAEVLVSRDFGSNCLNIGVVYLKAHPDTAFFLTSLLGWLWHHPYEFCQKAFSAFLGQQSVTQSTMFGNPVRKIPRWGVLDPLNAFVTNTVYNAEVEGWTGNLEDIVLYHFLDGTGGADADRAVFGKYVNLYELFYANPALDLRNADSPLWVQDARVKEQLMSGRRSEAPSVLVPCTMLPIDAIGKAGKG